MKSKKLDTRLSLNRIRLSEEAVPGDNRIATVCESATPLRHWQVQELISRLPTLPPVGADPEPSLAQPDKPAALNQVVQQAVFPPRQADVNTVLWLKVHCRWPLSSAFRWPKGSRRWMGARCRRHMIGGSRLPRRACCEAIPRINSKIRAPFCFTALISRSIPPRCLFTFLARATTLGQFAAPPPKIEEMYHPETFGRGASDRVVVEELVDIPRRSKPLHE